MRMLVLGGTVFVGRAFVEAALAAGHELTLFHRGQNGADLFPQAEHVLGDRDGGIEALSDRKWDVVVDTCGYVPRVVAQSAESLVDRAGHYLFVSTISVYPDDSPDFDEYGPLLGPPAPEIEKVDGETYGGLKVACEREVQKAWEDRCTIVRPGLIVGPHDRSDRFTYWPVRASEPGLLLCPLPKEERVQFIDVRDLAKLLLASAERSTGGIFNATGPVSGITFGELIDACIEAGGRVATPVWAAPEALEEEAVQPWTDLPFWVPGDSGRSLRDVPLGRAIAAGLSTRPLQHTLGDTLAWYHRERVGHALRWGMDRERQTRIAEKLLPA